MEMFRAGCSDNGKAMVEKCLQSVLETMQTSFGTEWELDSFPSEWADKIQENFKLLDDLVPEYSGHIDSPWHAIRYANRLRKIAEEMD